MAGVGGAVQGTKISPLQLLFLLDQSQKPLAFKNTQIISLSLLLNIALNAKNVGASMPPGQLFLLAGILFSNFRNLTHASTPSSKLLYEAFSPFVDLLPNVDMIHILGVNEISPINGSES